MDVYVYEFLSSNFFYNYLQNADEVENKVPSLLGKGPIPAPQQLLIMAPSTGDEYDSDQGSEISDEENRPLTQGELKQRIMKGVSIFQHMKSIKGGSQGWAPLKF